MTTVRVPRRDHPFALIEKATLFDPRLSFRATGLLAWLLSKPDDWRIDIRHLATVKAEGYKAVAAAMRELRRCGYVVRRRVTGPDGQFTWEATIYETPELAAAAQVSHISTGTVDPQATMSPFLPHGATSGNGESEANVAGGTMSPKPPDGFGDSVLNKETDRPARARAKANPSRRPQPVSTDSAPPGYVHDPAPSPGHDPAACGRCADDRAAAKPAVPAEIKRGWREAVGVPWPDGPAPPPPIDEDAERARQLAELANLEHPEAFPKTPPDNRRL